MSNKGNYYDNAFAESFFKTFKIELIYHKRYKTRDKAKQDIFEYMEVYYNRQRIHFALGYKTPEKFENQRDVA
jgi:putative transposase